MHTELQQLIRNGALDSERLYEQHAAEIESVARRLPAQLLAMLPPLVSKSTVPSGSDL